MVSMHHVFIPSPRTVYPECDRNRSIIYADMRAKGLPAWYLLYAKRVWKAHLACGIVLQKEKALAFARAFCYWSG
jgi:hypothetical protein